MAIDDPFEYLTFGGTFGRSFGLLFDRFDLFMAVSVVAMIPFFVIYLTMAIFLASVFIQEEENPDFHPTHIPLLVLTFGVQILVYDLASVIGQGAITQAVSEIYVGQRPEWLQCLTKAWSRKWQLLGASLIVYGSSFVSLIPVLIAMNFATTYPNAFTITLSVLITVAFIAGVVYFYFGAILASPAIMVEGFNSSMKGVKRSWELAVGSRCYLICTLFCLWFLNQLIARLLHNMFVTGDIMDIMFSLVGVVVTFIPMFLAFPLHAIMETVLYLNLRIGRESMNHQVLVGDLTNDASLASRFRREDQGGPTLSEEPMDYRHVPLVDADDTELTEQRKEQTMSFV